MKMKVIVIFIVLLLLAVIFASFILQRGACAMLYVGYKNTETGACETFSGCSAPAKYVLDENCVNQFIEKEMPKIIGECTFEEQNCKNGKIDFCNQIITKFQGTKFEKKFTCSEVVADNNF